MLDLREISKSYEKYAFGTDGLKVAALLREFADKVEAKIIAPQQLIYQQTAAIGDFTMDILLIGYAEKRADAPEVVKALDGAGAVTVDAWQAG